MGVREDIAVQIAELGRLVDAPTGALGYGTDLACVTDLTPNLDEVDPNSITAIGEALLRRLSTPTATLPDDLDYGLDVRGYCNRATTQQELRALGSAIRAECMKDDRVEDATVSVSQSGKALGVTVSITAADPAFEDFSLTFSVTDSEVLLNSIDVTS